jgi:dihydroxyacetone kinase-like protein
MGGATAGKESLSLAEFATAFEAGIGGVQRIGKAEPGDKTMLEALLPARDALAAAAADGSSIGVGLERAAEAAEAGMAATVPLVARKGRASYLGERSAGHQDPGATSSALLLRSAAQAWSGI